MVVQHAWENSDEEERAEMPDSVSQMREWLSENRDSDEEDESEHEGFATDDKGCLGRVRDMMNRFMIRGSHSPMQWMLDLRTYGMRIITTPPVQVILIGLGIRLCTQKFNSACGNSAA